MSLYVWGSNKSKQLNTQNALHCYSPVYTPGACGDNVPIAVAAGESHTLVLCESGEIYSFGRGKDGQLGHGGEEANKANIVGGLENETVIAVAAGSASSFAITSTGNVYQWGLVYRGSNLTLAGGAETGQLHGLAQDQDNFMVEVDLEARQEEAAAAAQWEATHPTVVAESRQLRDLVRDSTEQWQLPPVEADNEYREVLQKRGFQPNEIKQRMAERDREYVQMLTKGCMRAPVFTPQLVPRLRHVRVKAVAMGYAHTMLLTENGMLYAAGYNDRGQLGLGHRINTSEFKLVDYLSEQFVVQVACGQQHTVCRVVDRENSFREEPMVGSEDGADVYIWGNGTLGQLGLGKLGTTKGRLFPTRIESIFHEFQSGIVCVSAGANFTALVTDGGDVYSFGHSEYNQHGDRTGAHHDYAEAHYYFVPRRVNITRTQATGAAYQRTGGRWSSAASAAPERVHVKRISCGACFTLAIDLHGDLYSWGWNESGVLGHGVRHFASSPLRIPSIGANFDGCKVRAVHAGGNHVAALTDSQGNAWASSFHSILESNNHADCMICIDDKISEVAAKFAPTGKKKASGAKQGPFLCHRAILAARCTFLRGFIQAALRDAQGTEVYSVKILTITLPSDHANAVTVKSLLDYLYMDRIHIAGHKRQELALLATDLHLERLATILSADADSAPQLTRSLASTFTENMVNLSRSSAHSDVVFVVPKDRNRQKFCGEDGSDGALRVFDPEEHEFVSYGHLVVVGSRLPYFEVLLSSGFSESHNTVLIRAPLSGTVSKAVQIDVSGLVMEGIELATFEMVLLYAYTGLLRAQSDGVDPASREEEDETNPAVDLNDVMAVLVAANRLGFTSLMQHCERLLSLHLGNYFPHNAQNCLEFATAYNIPRLERQCREILGKAGAKAVV